MIARKRSCDGNCQTNVSCVYDMYVCMHECEKEELATETVRQE
jgi:hypothetical protein